ncbi:helix-turn-helix domain-containing protein [Desulfosarcina cetonica]|uniref:helix-turn-helix domain-containing protein n=1 Tax=Desulfosarcina cetonica TaxID=90730 RepID=UPI0006D1F6AC|nr:XRE family transcriptional regulator [Desulfosarcina cetonica]
MSTKKDDLDQRIAVRIRIERESRGWSLTDLAERSGVSRAMIHKIERGISSPTAMILGRLSGAFNLSMSKLIARAEIPDGHLLRHGDQPVWVDPQSGYIRRHVSPRSDLPLDLVRIELPPGAEIPMPASAYAFIQQLIWVLSGSLVFIEAAVRHEIEEGDCLELGAPVDCIFKNESSQVCSYLVVVLSR